MDTKTEVKKPKKAAKVKKCRSASAIDRQWLRRAARIAKSSGLAALDVWVKNSDNQLRFHRQLDDIHARVRARAK